ncbi:MAG: hypothetical protein LBL13_13815 [Bacteroidales bacterium]|jgi:hypothetical protein|nr:hypothetical protein [Bacteroidales bacterium]
MVLSIARQGIYINRMEDQQNGFIARQGIHLFSIGMIPARASLSVFFFWIASLRSQ